MDLESVDNDLARARTTAHVNRSKIQQSWEIIKRASEIIERLRQNHTAVPEAANRPAV